MSLLDPVSTLLATVVAGAHHALTSLGADPDSAATWVACIASVVVVVRLALLPVVAHGVRTARAAARARPQLRALQERYRGHTDVASFQQFRQDRREIAAEHGLSRLGCLPALAQVPVWMALYHLLSSVAAGSSMGAMDHSLVASLGAAALLGVPLAERGYLGAGLAHLAVVTALALLAAGFSFVTQRYVLARNIVTDGLPDAVVSAQQLLPAVSAVSLLVMGGVVPVALLVYWVCSAGWTLAQSAAIVRWWPTPGTPAAAKNQELGPVD